MMKIPVTNIQNLGHEFNIYQKHEMEIWQVLYFQVRESPAPLNMPIPTPAPDRGGPVAWVGGPVA